MKLLRKTLLSLIITALAGCSTDGYMRTLPRNFYDSILGSQSQRGFSTRTNFSSLRYDSRCKELDRVTSSIQLGRRTNTSYVTSEMRVGQACDLCDYAIRTCHNNSLLLSATKSLNTNVGKYSNGR